MDASAQVEAYALLVCIRVLSVSNGWPMSVMVEPAAAPAAQGCQAVDDIRRRPPQPHKRDLADLSLPCEDRVPRRAVNACRRLVGLLSRPGEASLGAACCPMGCAYSAPNPVQAALAPPIQKGHPLLGQLVEVLRAEYEMRQPQSVGRWLDTVNELSLIHI